MNDSQWEEKLKGFLKKTGEDFKKFGNDIRVEAEHLMTEVKDPKRQEKVRDGLREIGVWARKAAEDAAVIVGEGVQQAGKVINKAADQVSESVTKGAKAVTTPEPVKAAKVDRPAPEAPKAAATQESQAPKKQAKKTVGRGAGKSTGTKAKSTKTIGKKAKTDE